MALPTGLTHAALRELQLDALIGRPIAGHHIEAMCETLLKLLEEAQDTGEEHASIDDLHGVIIRLEKMRVDAVEEHDKLLEETDEEKAVIRAEATLVAQTADEWKRRAELAEHELIRERATAARSDHERAIIGMTGTTTPGAHEEPASSLVGAALGVIPTRSQRRAAKKT